MKNIMKIVTSTSDRVIENGGIYNILAVDHMNFKKRSIKFRCKKEVRS